jgi:hypothetical protein
MSLQLLYSAANTSALDKFLSDRNEVYIDQVRVQWIDQSHNQQQTLLLITKQTLYEIKLQSQDNNSVINEANIIQALSFLDIYSIDINTYDATNISIILKIFPTKFNANVSATMNKVKRILSSNQSNHINQTIHNTIQFKDNLNCMKYHLILRKLLGNAWQKYFESSLIPQPHYYLKHFFTVKKYNECVLVVSNQNLYSIQLLTRPSHIAKINLYFPVALLSNMTINHDKQSPIIILHTDPAQIAEFKSKEMKSKNQSNSSNDTSSCTENLLIDTAVEKLSEMNEAHHTFSFDSVENRNHCLTTVMNIYKKLVDTDIEVNSIDTNLD